MGSEQKQYVIICDTKKHTFRRRGSINSAIREAERLTKKAGAGFVFSVCKVKGAIESVNDSTDRGTT